MKISQKRFADVLKGPWILQWIDKLDELVKSLKTPFFVIPAKAGIQFLQLVT